MSPDIPKPSFAKVNHAQFRIWPFHAIIPLLFVPTNLPPFQIAASVNKEKGPSSPLGRSVTSPKGPPTGPVTSSVPAPAPAPAMSSEAPTSTPLSQVVLASQATNSAAAAGNGMMVESVIKPFTAMSIKTPNLVVNGSNSASLDRARPIASRESGSDESGKADSSSELGTKPPSLDGKSITSGTTFALDEKESLRPDDSASVKAAAEDDDAFSIRGSLLAGSRMGSDAAFRARHLQLGDLPDRRLLQPTVGSHGQGVSTPPSASSEQPPSVGPPVPLASVAGSSDALGVIYRQAPDEKLLEALASPRDRLFLLRLEKDVIGFVQDSK